MSVLRVPNARLNPAVVAFSAGWLHLPHIEPPLHPAAPDRTPPEAWAAFAVFYLFWIVGGAILLVWCYDRLGYHWQPHERKPRLSRKERRKRAAVMGALGCRRAALLDGGISAQLLVKDEAGERHLWRGVRRVQLGLVATAR